MTTRREDVEATEATWERAKNVLLTGLWTPSGGLLHHADGTFPLLAERGEGCILYDSTGGRYVDWVMGMGALLLGYRHPAVEQALREHVDTGPVYSLLHPRELEVAEQLCEIFPCAERVVFGKNGSDVLAVAVRGARAMTGRDIILTHGYHGFHDWYMASQPWCQGVPACLQELIVPFPYNDLGTVRDLFNRLGDRIAAVVMEPITVTWPEAGFLEGVRQLASDNGSLLVFDENVTAFRIATGGAQEVFGVVPDLACIGKELGSGMGLTALVGKRAIMEGAWRLGYGLRPDAPSFAVARACLRVYREEPVAEHVARIGSAIRDGFDAAASRLGIRGGLHGPPARTSLKLSPAGGITEQGLQTLFIQECLKEGVLTNGSFLPSYAHDDEAVNLTTRAFDSALETVARAIGSRTLDGFLLTPAIDAFYEDAGSPDR